MAKPGHKLSGWHRCPAFFSFEETRPGSGLTVLSRCAEVHLLQVAAHRVPFHYATLSLAWTVAKFHAQDIAAPLVYVERSFLPVFSEGDGFALEFQFLGLCWIDFFALLELIEARSEWILEGFAWLDGLFSALVESVESGIKGIGTAFTL